MKCIFSGMKADTKEHVIPAWLQKKMKLGEESLRLPNGTQLKYKHVVVPAQKKHNQKFSEIENNISNGILNHNEVYLWALKIHIGLLFRDSTLKLDIKNPNSEFIVNLGEFHSEVNLFRALYDNWNTGGSTNPSPFGSVFVVDSITPHSQFDFMHCAITGAVGINIGSKFILVILWDKGKTLNSNILDEWHNYRLPNLRKLKDLPEYESHCYMALRVWACEAAYFSYLHRSSSISIIKSKSSVTAFHSFASTPPKDFNDFEYMFICRSFGLERLNQPEIGKYVYTQFSTER